MYVSPSVRKIFVKTARKSYVIVYSGSLYTEYPGTIFKLGEREQGVQMR